MEVMGLSDMMDRLSIYMAQKTEVVKISLLYVGINQDISISTFSNRTWLKDVHFGWFFDGGSSNL